jgi:hypothetical protein
MRQMAVLDVRVSFAKKEKRGWIHSAPVTGFSSQKSKHDAQAIPRRCALRENRGR